MKETYLRSAIINLENYLSELKADDEQRELLNDIIDYLSNRLESLKVEVHEIF